MSKQAGISLAHFANEQSAHDYVERLVWPNGPKCVRCGHDEVSRLNGATTPLGTLKCRSCKKKFSVTHGTVFSRTHVPLHKWLQAIYLTDGGADFVRPHHLANILNVSFKTAAYIVRRLEAARGPVPPGDFDLRLLYDRFEPPSAATRACTDRLGPRAS